MFNRCVVILLALSANAAGATAANITILHSFSLSSGDGYGGGYDSLAINNGTLYGSTQGGGSNSRGTLFTMQLDGSQYRTIYSFSSADRVSPAAYGVTLDGPTIYGTSLTAGDYGRGAVYKIQTNGTGFQRLHSFATTNGDGYQMYSGVVSSGSRLYGTTVVGGSNDNGIVFSLNKGDGSDYQVLHTFTGGIDGSRPYGAPIVDGSILYGMSLSSIYRINADNKEFEVLKSGVGGFGKLTLDGSTLYGISNSNTVFRIDTDGSDYQVLHTLDGASQSGLALVGSTLYGVTRHGGNNQKGSVFSVNTDGTDYHLLYSFVGDSTDGYGPIDDPIVIGSTLYGRAAGGPNVGGIIFSLAVPEPSTIILLNIGAIISATYPSIFKRRRNV